jgi:hypothetical protein
MAKFKGNEGIDKTYSANASEAGIMSAVQDLMKVIPIGTKDTLTIVHNANGTYSVTFSLA